MESAQNVNSYRPNMVSLERDSWRYQACRFVSRHQAIVRGTPRVSIRWCLYPSRHGRTLDFIKSIIRISEITENKTYEPSVQKVRFYVSLLTNVITNFVLQNAFQIYRYRGEHRVTF